MTQEKTHRLHKFSLRVYYEDTDMAGIVYYANYLRFTERARSEAVEEAGVDQHTLRRDRQIVFVVRAMQSEFIATAHLGNRLVVETVMEKLGRASIALKQNVFLDENTRGVGDTDKKLIFSSTVTIVCVKLGKGAIPWPADMREQLENFFTTGDNG